MSDKAPLVTVVGSLNVDYVARVGRLPMPGETVPATALEMVHGGKGANQAIAAARQDCQVRMIGSVGTDDNGKGYLKALGAEGIKTEGVRAVRKMQTGMAFIHVDGMGENTIVVSAGANGMTSADQVRAQEADIEDADVLLAQFEVPLGAVVEALRIANRAGVLSIVNPSPLRPTFPWASVEIDYLIVNEFEGEEILEDIPLALDYDCEIRDFLKGLRVNGLIVTRGSDPTLVIGPEQAFEAPTLAVVPVDTVGAGDAFAGCFAARLAHGETLWEAVLAANCAGALTTLRPGAQRPIPDRETVDRHLAQL
ncbi:MAG: ribokinase [Verrucomicrobiales bacterium]|nr:ribokinase [Verrucomicrobiales bacterium]